MSMCEVAGQSNALSPGTSRKCTVSAPVSFARRSQKFALGKRSCSTAHRPSVVGKRISTTFPPRADRPDRLAHPSGLRIPHVVGDEPRTAFGHGAGPHPSQPFQFSPLREDLIIRRAIAIGPHGVMRRQREAARLGKRAESRLPAERRSSADGDRRAPDRIAPARRGDDLILAHLAQHAAEEAFVLREAQQRVAAGSADASGLFEGPADISLS